MGKVMRYVERCMELDSKSDGRGDVSGRLPAAILFDLDDTILDDSGAMESCWREACAMGAAKLGSVQGGELWAAIEKQRNWYWSDPRRHREGRMDLRAASRRIVQTALSELGVGSAELGEEIADRYRDLREERLCLVPGALETLEELRARGVRLGLMTNGSAGGQRAKIERFGLARWFDHIVIEGEFGAGKPDTRVYEAVLAGVSANPAETWSVGDNLEWDVGAPQRLGVYGIWVDVAGDGLPAGTNVSPDRIVGSIREII